MFSLVILCALVAATSAGYLAAPYAYLGAPAVTYAAPAVAYAAPYLGSTQYRAQDTLGQYSYGYATGNGIQKNEARGIDGSVAGSYGYTAPDGKRIDISYTAGADGFKATGDAIPKPVENTPEVKEATMQHLSAKTEAELKAAEAPKAIAVAAPLAYAGFPYGHHYGYAYGHPHLAYKALIHGAPAVNNYGYSYAYSH